MMYIVRPLAVFFLHVALSYSEPAAPMASCGDAPGCFDDHFCETATFTTPTATTITTCVPTPTCLGVYASCSFGGTGPFCCSQYCAATKCRPTDDDWPNCKEDGHVCIADENCCYDNKCVDGLCASTED